MSAQFSIAKQRIADSTADVLVLLVSGPFEDSALLQSADKMLSGGLFSQLESARFEADKGAVIDSPAWGTCKAKRLVVVGVRPEDCGDTAQASSSARLTEAASLGVRTSLAHRPQTVHLAVESDDYRALALGLSLGAYRFDKYLTEKVPGPKQVKLLAQQTVSVPQKAAFSVGTRLGDGVCLARDLINEPPNVLTPAEFAARARQVAKKNKLTAKILNHAALKKAGMHLHDAVGKGSDNEPYFIHLSYKPARAKGKVAFVGKGITFDSGGLCIKPAGGMIDMKSDMSGGAAVLGMMEAVAALKLPIEVHGIIGAAENMPDAGAYRPSDVVVGLAGKGVEVINTDAEGRLVLADALTYAARLEPDFIVDAATLTGATLLSLSPTCSAFFTGSSELAQAMTASAREAGESFWRMPLIEELRAQLKSSVTDLQHTGERMGGAITAALFLREFTNGLPWMHCDVPGPVYRDRPSGMHPKGGTGHTVLTFLKLIERHASEPVTPADSSSPKSRTSVRAKATSARRSKVSQIRPAAQSAKKKKRARAR